MWEVSFVLGLDIDLERQRQREREKALETRAVKFVSIHLSFPKRRERKKNLAESLHEVQNKLRCV